MKEKNLIVFTNALISPEPTVGNLNVIRRAILRYCDENFFNEETTTNSDEEEMEIGDAESKKNLSYPQGFFRDDGFVSLYVHNSLVNKFRKAYTSHSEIVLDDGFTLQLNILPIQKYSSNAHSDGKLKLFAHSLPNEIIIDDSLARSIFFINNILWNQKLFTLPNVFKEILYFENLIPKFNCTNWLVNYHKSLQQATELNIIPYYNYINYKTLTNYGILNNEFLDTDSLDRNVILFIFNESPEITNYQGVHSAKIKTEHLLEFKQFLLEHLMLRKNQKWAIDESDIVIDSLFRLIVDDQYLTSVFFPEVTTPYWFAIPKCGDLRNEKTKHYFENQENHPENSILFTKHLSFMSDRMYDSLQRPYFMPISEQLLRWLTVSNFRNNMFVYRKNPIVGYNVYSNTGVEII